MKTVIFFRKNTNYNILLPLTEVGFAYQDESGNHDIVYKTSAKRWIKYFLFQNILDNLFILYYIKKQVNDGQNSFSYEIIFL